MKGRKEANHKVIRRYVVVVVEDSDTEYELNPVEDFAHVISKAEKQGKLTAADLEGHRSVTMVCDHLAQMHNEFVEGTVEKLLHCPIEPPIPTVTVAYVEETPVPTPSDTDG